MNYVQAQQFLAIVKYMNISKAASELYISQPALSLALGRLEKELGLSLFYRDGNKLILSPAGENLYDYFKDLNDSYQRLLQRAEEIKNTPEEFINLGFSGSAIQFVALSQTNIFDVFTKKCVRKICADPELLTQLLLSKQIDFAISYPPLQHEALSSASVMEEEIGVAVSANHPLARYESIPLSALRSEGFYGQSRQFKWRTYVDSVLGQNNFKARYIKESKTADEFFQTIDQKANSTDYIAFCPVSAMDNIYQYGYKFLRISDCTLARITTLSWLTDRKLQYQDKSFVDGIVQNYEKLMEKHVEITRVFNEGMLDA